MRVPLVFIETPIAGIDRYIIQEFGHRVRVLPELMRPRYYITGRIFTLDNYELPMLWDMIEYDYRLKEWFIVRQESMYNDKSHPMFRIESRLL